jgi:ABC-2 type transport system permease protein
LALTWIAAVLYVGGVLLVGEPGVWRTILSARTFIMFGLLGPLVELATLQVSVIVSSRANDPRSAQQLTSLLILPITIVFIAQLMASFVLTPAWLLLGCTVAAALNTLLLMVGVRVFERETILTRWR